MHVSIARATVVSLLIVALTGCKSGGGWPWSKKTDSAATTYPAGNNPGAAYEGQASANVQMPSATTPPYNVGNNYAPATSSAQASGAGLYPEAVPAAGTAYGASPNYGAPAAYGTASTYPTAPNYGATAANAGGYEATPPASAYPSTAYPSTAGAGMPGQDPSYGSSAMASAAGAYQPSAYGAMPPGSYSTQPAASAYPATESAPPAYPSNYPATAPESYPSTAAAQPYSQPTGYQPPSAAADPMTAAAGGAVAYTADNRYSRYDNTSAAGATSGYSTSAPAGGASAYPPAAGYSYPSSSYQSAPSGAPAAGAPYRPGGTTDYVPTTPGGNLPSGYGATGSGVRPAGYDEASAMPGVLSQ